MVDSCILVPFLHLKCVLQYVILCTRSSFIFRIAGEKHKHLNFETADFLWTSVWVHLLNNCFDIMNVHHNKLDICYYVDCHIRVSLSNFFLSVQISSIAIQVTESNHQLSYVVSLVQLILYNSTVVMLVL